MKIGKIKHRSENQILHPLDIADSLSSNAWLKWTKKQEKMIKNNNK